MRSHIIVILWFWLTFVKYFGTHFFFLLICSMSPEDVTLFYTHICYTFKTDDLRKCLYIWYMYSDFYIFLKLLLYSDLECKSVTFHCFLVWAPTIYISELIYVTGRLTDWFCTGTKPLALFYEVAVVVWPSLFVWKFISLRQQTAFCLLSVWRNWWHTSLCNALTQHIAWSSVCLLYTSKMCIRDRWSLGQ